MEKTNQETHELDWVSPFRHSLILLRRRWKLLAMVFGTCVLVAGGIAAIMTPLYRAESTLEIRPEAPLLSSTETADPALAFTKTLWENYYRTQEAILTSSTLIRATLKSLPEPIRNKYASAADPTREFSKHLYTEKSRSSFLITVGFVDRDAEMATQVVNTWVSLYLVEANRRLRETRTNAADFLSKHSLPSIKQTVEHAEKAFQECLASGNFRDPQEQYAAQVESHRTVIAKETQLRLKRIQLGAQIDSLANYGEDPQASLFNATFYNTKILDLLVSHMENLESELVRQRQELKDEHPAISALKDQIRRVDEKIQAALRGAVQSLAIELSSTEQEESAVVGELARLETEMGNTIRRVSQYKKLDAEVTAARELYNAYLKKQGEVSATSGAGLGSVHVVDVATLPASPWLPNVPLFLAFGAVAGIVLGGIALFIREKLQSPTPGQGDHRHHMACDDAKPRIAG